METNLKNKTGLVKHFFQKNYKKFSY